jgi:hypothetical protein
MSDPLNANNPVHVANAEWALTRDLEAHGWGHPDPAIRARINAASDLSEAIWWYTELPEEVMKWIHFRASRRGKSWDLRLPWPARTEALPVNPPLPEQSA